MSWPRRGDGDDTDRRGVDETDWFKAVVYIVIAVIIARVVDFILARRDRPMASSSARRRTAPTARATS